ncbi:MAG TPA: HPF/RaiA family ribosome-associated protein [Usitatibacter sp.]|nr:HPF/RaiA family ribosome-associated protein [Usitatibacter sp.]
MQTPLQITLQNVPPSDALDARIRDDLARLEHFHPRITSCRVVVEEEQKHRQQGRQFAVRIEVRAPAHEDLVSTLQHHEDVYVALRDAFRAVRRQLEDRVREARGDVKCHAEPRHGRVARLDHNEGFGFIETDEGDEIYFSRDNVVSPPFEHLMPGTEVQFLEEAAGDGVQAKRVSAGKHRFD